MVHDPKHHTPAEEKKMMEKKKMMMENKKMMEVKRQKMMDEANEAETPKDFGKKKGKVIAHQSKMMK